MGGSSGSREQNYEMKYLRKELLRIDSRVQIPESISGDALLHLLDEVEQPNPHGAAKRARPRWLSLQSGIAYAAAFVLIVALFYSTRLYRPDIITGDIRINESQNPNAAAPADNALDANQQGQPEEAGVLMAAGNEQQSPDTQPSGESAPADSAVEAAPELPHAVGGSGMATFLLEHESTAYYWRLNDETDPDRSGYPCTLEIVDVPTGRIASQINYESIQSVAELFVIGDRLVVIGTANNPDASLMIYVYDSADPLNPVEISAQIQLGAFIDAKVYKDIVHIASVSDTAFDDVEELPGSKGGAARQYYVISALDSAQTKSYTKSFAGADGSVRLNDQSAYIRYAGEDGSKKDFHINFSDFDIGLDTVR